MVTHFPLGLCFWMASGVLGTAGRTVPEKRTLDPRLTFRWVTEVRTSTWTLTVTIGLTMLGLLATSTRYCVVSGTESRVNENAPLASVSCALETFEKPDVNGNGFCCSCTALPEFPVP